MISDATQKVINKYVDEYIDELRFEFICLKHNRQIKAIEENKFVVQDSDVILDAVSNYEKVLLHPIVDYLIPDKVELFVTEFIVVLEPPELLNLINFDVSGVIYAEEISLDDTRISDDEIRSLISQTCFDDRYQKMFPEVRTFLEDFYKTKHPEHFEKIMARLRPFLGV